MPIFSNKENVQVECTQIYKNMWHGPKYISEYNDLSTSIIMIIYWKYSSETILVIKKN